MAVALEGRYEIEGVAEMAEERRLQGAKADVHTCQALSSNGKQTQDAPDITYSS